MNNLTFGGYDERRGQPFAYYETMGGGMGARPGADGLAGVHVHMSNTRNTPIEVLEMNLPVSVRRYALRVGSGGAGRYRGGDGLCRELIFLAPATVTILTERRKHAPYGLWGGAPGLSGINSLERAGERQELAGKGTFDVIMGDILCIHTPGGGGFLPEGIKMALEQPILSGSSHTSVLNEKGTSASESLSLCVAHTCMISTSGSIRCGLSAEISMGGVCPRIIAARLSATAGACIIPWPLKPQEAHTPNLLVSPTRGCSSKVIS
jgi:hypothetical protein